MLLAVAGVLAAAAGPGGADAQEDPAFRLALSADAGASLQDNLGGIGLGRDMVTYGLRITAVRSAGLSPWVDAGLFRRPGLECTPALPCSESGSLVRTGLAFGLTRDESSPGLQGEARGGLGAAFAADPSLSYLVAFNLYWRQIPRVSPVVEVRWEHITGINLTMLAAGVRIDL